MIHIYYGDGKGKSTAALGLALRAAGHGQRVMIVQFLKNRPSGEIVLLERIPNIRLLRGQAGDAFSIHMTPEEKRATKGIHNANLQNALENLPDCDMLILDECLDAYQLGLLDEALFKHLMNETPPHLELVITGHNPEPWIFEKADYITHMHSEKHPFDRGVAARKGVEY